MIWSDMDSDERMHVIWRGTHDGKLVKQIASESGTASRIIREFAAAHGIVVRVRLPAIVEMKRRKRAATPLRGKKQVSQEISTLSTQNGQSSRFVHFAFDPPREAEDSIDRSHTGRTV